MLTLHRSSIKLFSVLFSIVTLHSTYADEPKAFRTFVTVEGYAYDSKTKPVDDVDLEIAVPGYKVSKLPVSPKGNKVAQGSLVAINHTLEIPTEAIKQDGFNLNIQIMRKGATLNPCTFQIKNISDYNRTYVCRTDNTKLLADRKKFDNAESDMVRIKVYTDLIRSTVSDKSEQFALKNQ